MIHYNSNMDIAKKTDIVKYCELDRVLTSNNVVSKSKNNFIEIDNVQYIIKNNCATVSRYVGDEEELIIPSSIEINGNQYTVESIGKYAFANCNCLKIIKLPNTLSSIGEKVFSNCNNLKKVYFNESIKKWKRITKKINSFGYYNPSLKLIALNDTIFINGDVIEIIDDEEIW